MVADPSGAMAAAGLIYLAILRSFRRLKAEAERAEIGLDEEGHRARAEVLIFGR